jgi:hypothetical protein
MNHSNLAPESNGMSAWQSCSRRHRPARAIFMRPLELKSNTVKFSSFFFFNPSGLLLCTSLSRHYGVVARYYTKAFYNAEARTSLACTTRLGNRCDELTHPLKSHHMNTSYILFVYMESINKVQKQHVARLASPELDNCRYWGQELFSIYLRAWVDEIHI